MAHGATVGGSPAEVIKKCTITIGILADPAAALSVCILLCVLWCLTTSLFQY